MFWASRRGDVMHDIGFLRDLAIVMMVAGATTIIFHRLRQPALLGYILAGMLIGPYTPGVLVGDQKAISDIADLGVVLLMFTLGLEFSIGKLRRVGMAVMLVALGEVAFMLLVGYQLGLAFGWSHVDAMFLAGGLGLSSTMVVTRVLRDQDLMRRPFARDVVSLLVAEDVLSVVLITLLTAVAIGGSVETGDALSVLGHLLLFVVAAILIGLLVLPRLIDYVANFQRNEMLLVTVLGVCFGASLLADFLGFSVALGAFIAGAVVAESRSTARIVHLVEPLRDMFAALFFVAIGLMINPMLLARYWLPALVVALAVILGKTLACGMGTFLAGHGARRGLRTGLGMATIGEFSFVMVSIGVSYKAVNESVYPVIVAVSVICMAVSPHLLRRSDSFARGLARLLPHSWRVMLSDYTEWLGNVRPVSDNAVLAAMFRRLLWHIAVNISLVITLFIVGAYLNAHDHGWFTRFGIDRQTRHALIWAAALFLSLPMLIAVYRKAEALGMLLAELGIRSSFAGKYTHPLRRVLARIIPLATLLVLALMVMALSSTILPPRGLALSLVVLGVLLALFLWRALVRLHARFQAAIKDTLAQTGSETGQQGHQGQGDEPG